MKILKIANTPTIVPHALSVRNKWDSRTYYGRGGYGVSFYQQKDEFAGIYQQRACVEGKLTVLMKFYTPTNPRTPIQQAKRANFANAISSWQSLTDEEKQIYNNNAKGKPLSGYNLFIRQYLLSL